MAIALNGQAPDAGSRTRRPGAPLAFLREQYRVRAGEAVPIAVYPESAAFLRTARSSSIRTVRGETNPGLELGRGARGESILLGASLLAEPGLQRMSLEVISASGEVRLAELEVMVEPLRLPSAANSIPPIIFLNGFQPFGFDGLLPSSCPISASSSETFGEMADLLYRTSNRQSYFFDNCRECKNCTIEELGARLGMVLAHVHYSNGAPIPEFDVVAHSMGGLIVRSYLVGKQPGQRVFAPLLNHKIRKSVFIATPHFGSFVASNFGTQMSQMFPGSQFLMDLATWNQQGDDLRGVDAIAIAGNLGDSRQDDGVVRLTSQSLGFAASDERTRVLSYCHSTYGYLESFVTDCWGDGIADVAGVSHPSFRIVRSFLDETQEWRTIGRTPIQDPFLSLYGGMNLILKSEEDAVLSDIGRATASPLANVAFRLNSIYSDSIIGGSYSFSLFSSSRGTLSLNSAQIPSGRHTVGIAKLGTSIRSVGPAAPAPARGLVVNSGADITITGRLLGGVSAQVFAQSTTLRIVSASDTQIVAFLPPSFGGWVPLTVINGPQRASIGLMVEAPALPVIAVSPQQLSFAVEEGLGNPPPQTVQISNAGGGTLGWSAASSASWLRVSPASGGAPSTLTVSLSTQGLSAGSYTAAVLLSSQTAGQVSIPVALRISPSIQPLITVNPRNLSFQIAVGGTLPPAQNLSVNISGPGPAPWSASTRNDWLTVSPATGSGTASIQVALNTTAKMLPSGSYSALVTVAARSGQLQDIPIFVTVLPAAAPAVAVTGVVNGASYQNLVSPGSWVSIVGQNLSAGTRVWRADDFVNGRLPTVIDGVSVTINGLPAYPYFVSPGQLNVLAADDPSLQGARVAVVRVRNASSEGISTVLMQPVAPAFFGNGAGGVAAVHRDGSLNAPINQFPGSRPALPNELVSLFLTGLGQTAPSYPDGRIPASALPLGTLPRVTVGGVRTEVVYAGLVSPGVYQVNILVPAGAGSGLVSIVLQADSSTSAASGTLSLNRP